MKATYIQGEENCILLPVPKIIDDKIKMPSPYNEEAVNNTGCILSIKNHFIFSSLNFYSDFV